MSHEQPSANPAGVANQGEFHAKKPASEPLTTKGHAPGTLVGNDAAPEFHAKTLPAGTAPASSTFTPNTQSEIPGQAMNPNIAKETWTNAEDTVTGATSGDVNQGLGKPVGPQSSKELRDNTSESAGVMSRGGKEGEGAERKGDRFGEGPKVNPEGAEEKVGGDNEV